MDQIDPRTGEIAVPDKKLRHWDRLSVTDPQHTKPFQRPGGFKGTATRPIWNQYRLTMHFGPYGIGWGTDIPSFQTVAAGEEILVFCTLRCWYMDDNGERGEIYGVGGDKVMTKTQRGISTDDEAFKKAFTDALGNAFVKVGLSADVHMGMFEDSKYVAWARGQFAADEVAQGDNDRGPREERDLNPMLDNQERAALEAQFSVEGKGAPRSNSGARSYPQRPQAAPSPSEAAAEVEKRWKEIAADIDRETDAEMLLRLNEWQAFEALNKRSAELGPPAVHAERMDLLRRRAAKRREQLPGSLAPFGASP